MFLVSLLLTALFFFFRGGQLRRGGWEQLIKPSFWGNFLRNKRSGVQGNFVGDGR